MKYVPPPSSRNRRPHVPDRAHSHSQAEHGEAERCLQEERATLTRFYGELRDFDEVIKAKKQAAVDVDVQVRSTGTRQGKGRPPHGYRPSLEAARLDSGGEPVSERMLAITFSDPEQSMKSVPPARIAV